MGKGNGKECGPLRWDQAVAVQKDSVALGSAAEDGMIVEDKASLAPACLPLKNQGRGQAADAAADDHAVVDFSGLDRSEGKAFEPAIANLVSRIQYGEGVAVGVCVVADAAIAGA